MECYLGGSYILRLWKIIVLFLWYVTVHQSIVKMLAVCR